MQIPGLNLLNVPSPVVTGPTESPANANERMSSDSARPVSAHGAPELREPTPTAPSHQSPVQDGFPDTVTYDDRECSQVDTVLATAMPASLDPLDLALVADQSSDISGDEDAGMESTNTDSALSESEDDDLEHLIKSAPIGSLQGLEAEYDDNEDGMAAKDTGAAGLRTKNEVVEELGPVTLSDVAITDQTVIEYLGTIEKVMESVAIIRAHTDGEYRILDQGGVIVTESRKLVGTISDTFGPVKQPRYLVRLAETLTPSEHPSYNQPLYYVPELASFVFTQSLRGLKGSDASNLYDEEINDEEREFSDDEAEVAHKRNLKRKRGQDSGRRAARTGQENRLPADNSPAAGTHSQSTHYTPLSRPNMSAHTIDRYHPFGQSYSPPTLANPSVYIPGPSHERPHDDARDYRGYREQAMPQQALSPPNVSGGMSGPNYLPALPPGAYVNPAFFRPDHLAVLPPDIQRQMDILYNLRHPPPR